LGIREFPSLFSINGKNFSEKMTAVKSADGEKWWIALHDLDNNKFIFYEADSSGVNFSHRSD
jgi:hypothetical protein